MACRRQTRSGNNPSPYLGAKPIQCPPLFELGVLLQESVAQESDDLVEGPPQGPQQEDEDEQRPAPDTTPPTRKRPASPTIPGQSRAHQRRRRAREKAAVEKGQFPTARTTASYVAPSVPIPTGLVTESLPAAKGGYSAKQGQKAGAKKTWKASQLVGEEGFDYVAWDGYEPRPLLDHDGRIYAALVGQPRDETYLASTRRCHRTVLEEGSQERFKPEERRHCRGNFPAINVGITYGKGSPAPTNLTNAGHQGVVERLLADADVKRLASFASASFATWAPGVYPYYKEHLDKLWAHLPHLRRNFPKSIFPCAAFNFGPATCTRKHRDALNCPFGMCAIQALGNFDPKLGGHLVLWEIKKVVEFPPGSLVLIPSATITHSNTPIQPGETRMSFTQFCAGALFRFVDNGFRTEAALEEEDPNAYERMLEEKKKRWQMGLGLLSRLQDLVQPVAIT